jgi:hypothetical protein
MAGSAEQSSNTVPYRRRLQLSYITTFRNGGDSRTLVSSCLYNSADFTHKVRFYLCAYDLGTLYTITGKSSNY